MPRELKGATDEQLVAELKRRGHSESATALEQKKNAEAVVDGLPPPIPQDRFDPRARVRRGYAMRDRRVADAQPANRREEREIRNRQGDDDGE